MGLDLNSVSGYSHQEGNGDMWGCAWKIEIWAASLKELALPWNMAQGHKSLGNRVKISMA